jgi:hypothetical protein
MAKSASPSPHVRQHVRGVGEQREAVGQNPADDFSDQVQQREAEDEREFFLVARSGRRRV